ncbi:MAG: hypothetical protein LQ339_002709 [Xanthoria mediterranea]|nr:MAG: hypothetical protein LQ339_002709 [Xanthoria mediterranea]
MRFLCTYLSSLLFVAVTLSVPVDIPPASVTDNLFSNNPSLSLVQDTHYSYHVPNTPISLVLVLVRQSPIERPALFRTIFTSQQTLRHQLSQESNRWLDADDDPYQVDDKRSGKCMIGMKSVHVGGTDGQRLTYRDVLDVMQGLWDVLYLGRNGYNTVYQIKNGSVVVGHGKIIVGNV